MKKFNILAAAIAIGAMSSPAAAERGVSADEIRLGTSLDLSGPITFWGVPMRNGYLMRVEEQNAKGGVHGRKIKLIIEDNGYDPKKGVLATQKLIAKDKVFALVGVLGTPVALASMPMALEKNVPFIFPGTNHRRTFEPLHRLTFSISAPYDTQVMSGIKYAVEKMGKKRIAVIYQDDEFGKDIRDAVLKQTKAMGMKVVAMASFKRGSTNFSSQVARVRRANPDLIFTSSIVRETIGIAAELKKLGWKVDMMTPASACNAAVAFLGKAAVEGVWVQCQYVPFNPATDSAEVKAWQGRYNKRFSKRGSVPAAISYEIMDITIKALTDAGKDLTQAKFLAAIEGIKNYRGIFNAPAITFGPKKHGGTTAFVLTRIEGGRFVRKSGEISN
ncbi:MAG: ABC transporter substrate-binding protein [Alphaproteobacteria bacterium]|nr:ABC transporter substrate-binding protein [Alphaproteobacteria bacterium]